MPSVRSSNCYRDLEGVEAWFWYFPSNNNHHDDSVNIVNLVLRPTEKRNASLSIVTHEVL